MRTALVLAAGKATRLGALSQRWAKACLPVGDTTPLGFLLPRLFASGCGKAVLNLHHRPDEVQAEARRAAPAGMALAFLEEPVLLGTGGTLAACCAGHGLPDLVVNAKIFTDLDFAAVVAAPAPLLVLHPGSDLGVFGGFRHRDGCVRGLRPRGGPARAPGAAVYTGVARPARGWLGALAAARRARPEAPLCLVRDGVLPFLEDGGRIGAWLHAGYWCEVSTPGRLAAARDLLARAKARRADARS